jgi:hypothetical protein
MEFRIAAAFALLGLAVGLGQWLAPEGGISYEVKFALLCIAILSALIAIGIFLHAAYRFFWPAPKGHDMRQLRFDAFSVAENLRRIQGRYRNDNEIIAERYKRTWQRGLSDEERDARTHSRQSEEARAWGLYVDDFQRTLPQVRIVLDRLLAANPTYNRDSADKEAELLIARAMVVGPQPLLDVANYLEKLARLLPED